MGLSVGVPQTTSYVPGILNSPPEFFPHWFWCPGSVLSDLVADTSVFSFISHLQSGLCVQLLGDSPLRTDWPPYKVKLHIPSGSTWAVQFSVSCRFLVCSWHFSWIFYLGSPLSFVYILFPCQGYACLSWSFLHIWKEPLADIYHHNHFFDCALAY